MAKYGQLHYRVFDEYTKTYSTSEGLNDLQDSKGKIIFKKSDNQTTWEKIGVQAKPGVEFYLNGAKIIMGRSGIFELEGVSIHDLYDYVKRTTQMVAEAKQMREAAQAYYNHYKIAELEDEEYFQRWELYYLGDPKVEYSVTDGVFEFREKAVGVTTTGWTEYKGQLQAEEDYLQASYGAYNELQDSNGQPLYEDLDNVIVDYLDSSENVAQGEVAKS